MRYTLWSRGRLLGESDLGFVQMHENHRTGWFRPSPLGERLMQVLTGPGPALKRIAGMMRDPSYAVVSRHTAAEREGNSSDIRGTTAYADLVSSVNELESMELQLRDSQGVILEVEHLGVDDMEFRLSLSKRRRRRSEKPGTDEDSEPRRQSLRRYQLQAYFPGSGFSDPANAS